jgi:hypothetical protein
MLLMLHNNQVGHILRQKYDSKDDKQLQDDKTTGSPAVAQHS